MKKLDPEQRARLLARLRKNLPVLSVIAAGVLLLLLPRTARTQSAAAAETQTAAAGFSVAAEEERVSAILTQAAGAGRVSVLLAVQGSSETVYAADAQSRQTAGGDAESSSDTVIVRTGTSTESPVTVTTRYPACTGAVIVAEGADSAEVRLALTQAVTAATGLGADAIVILKMK